MVLMKDQLAWNMGLTMCKVVNTILPTTLCSTIATLLAIAFDRICAIVKPIEWRMNSKKRAKLLVPLIWLVSVLVNIPLMSNATLKRFNSSTPYCDEGWSSDKEG